MYLEVKFESAAANVVALGDINNLTRFGVRVSEGCSPDAVDGSLVSAGAGRLDGDEAAISAEWLRRRTATRSDQWRIEFGRMSTGAAFDVPAVQTILKNEKETFHG